MADSGGENLWCEGRVYPLVCAALWLLATALLIFNIPGFVGADPYFHVQISRQMARGGLSWSTFHWVTESTWVDAWFDKDWLFHVLLAPFVSWDQLVGAKVFMLLAVLFVFSCLWLTFRSVGLSRQQASLWCLLLPCSCYGLFWLRLTVCRPHVLSIGFLALVIAFTLTRRRLALTVTAFVYTLSHASHWQLLGVVALFDLLTAFIQKDGTRRPRLKFDVPLFAYAFAGVAAATAAHPSFPRNIHGLFVQNVLVLFSAGAGTGATERIGELQPTGWRILWLVAPIFIAGAALIFVHIRDRRRPSRRVIFLVICAAGYLGLTSFALRFLDYAVPVAFLCVVVAWSECRSRLKLPFKTAYLELGFGVAVVIFSGFGLWNAGRKYYIQTSVTHAVAGDWLRQNLAPNEIVFVTRFHDNAILWFHAPDQRFLVFLDPIFMQRRSPERYQLWEQIRRGQHPDPVAAITGIFGSRIVFVIADPRVPDPERNAELKLVQQLEAAGAQCVTENPNTGARLYLLSQYPLRKRPRPATKPGPATPQDE